MGVHCFVCTFFLHISHEIFCLSLCIDWLGNIIIIIIKRLKKSHDCQALREELGKKNNGSGLEWVEWIEWGKGVWMRKGRWGVGNHQRRGREPHVLRWVQGDSEEVRSRVNLQVNLQRKAVRLPTTETAPVVVKAGQSAQQHVRLNLCLSHAKCQTRMETFSVISPLSSWAVVASCLVFGICTNPDTWHLVHGSCMLHFRCAGYCVVLILLVQTTHHVTNYVFVLHQCFFVGITWGKMGWIFCIEAICRVSTWEYFAKG